MNGLAPSRATRAVIGIVVGAFFAVPLVSTFLFTLRDTDGLSFAHWTALFDPAAAAARVALTRAMKNVIKTGLYLIGIEAPERM